MRPRFLIALLPLMVWLALPLWAAENQAALPENLQGLYGSLTGRVVSADPDGMFLVLRVTAIKADDKNNKASDPQAAVGKDLLIHIKHDKGADGALHPNEIDMQFIKNVEVGETTIIIVRADENQRLRIVDLPTLKRW